MTEQIILTPSELILLNCEKFIEQKKHFWTDVVMLPTRIEVPIVPLVEATLAGALLANEHSGDLCLETHSKQTLAGLRSIETVSVQWLGVGGTESWPTASLEFQIRHLAEVLSAKSRLIDVEDLVFTLSPGTEYMSPHPWSGVLYIIQNGLLARGVLEMVNKGEKKLRIMGEEANIEVSEGVMPLNEQESLKLVQALLGDCQLRRPALWRCLTAQITRGLQRCYTAFNSSILS